MKKIIQKKLLHYASGERENVIFMTSATHLEKITKKRYEVIIKDGKQLVLVSHATKDELKEYVEYLEKMCPVCHTQVNIDKLKEGFYDCDKCGKRYSLGEDYKFKNWEEWMDDDSPFVKDSIT